MDLTSTAYIQARSLKASSCTIAQKLTASVQRITGVGFIKVTLKVADMKAMLRRTRCISEKTFTSASICLNIRLAVFIRRPSTSTVRRRMEFWD